MAYAVLIPQGVFLAGGGVAFWEPGAAAEAEAAGRRLRKAQATQRHEEQRGALPAAAPTGGSIVGGYIAPGSEAAAGAAALTGEMDMSEVQVGAEIGRGSFGTVYRGRWRGADVAIKKLDVAEGSESAQGAS